MSPEVQESCDVFLSHAHVNAEIVELLGIRLQDDAKLRVWLDKWVLVPGEHWQQKMAKGLEQANTCVVCIGGNTPAGWFREETERALNGQSKDSTFRVIPVILPGGDQSLVDNFLGLRKDRGRTSYYYFKLCHTCDNTRSNWESDEMMYVPYTPHCSLHREESKCLL